MPEVDGFDVVERLRADPLVADVPIVVLTSKEMTPGDQERLAGRISFLHQKGTSDRRLWSSSARLAAADCPARGDDVTAGSHPHRRGQPAEPEARAGHPQPRRLRKVEADNAETVWRWRGRIGPIWF